MKKAGFFRILKLNFPNILFFGIILLAFFLRAQETISGNYLFLLDQGRDMMAVKSIVFDHHPTLIGPYTSLQGIFQGPIWYYLLSIPVLLTKGNPIGTVFLMLIISMLVVIISFLWARKNFGMTTALSIAFLFAVSPEAIAAATYSWNPHPMWLVILFFIISLFGLRKNKKYHILLWLTLSLMFHFEAALGVFFLLASFIYLLIFKRDTFKTKFFILGVLTGSLFFLPQVFFDLRHNFLMTKSIAALLAGSNQGLLVVGESSNYVSLVMGHYFAFLGNFKSAFIDQNVLSIIPLLFPVMLVFVFIFKKKTIQKNEKDLSLVIIRFIIIIYLLSFVYPFPIRYWFLTGFQSFYIILFGIFFGIFARFRTGKLLVSVLVICFLIFSVNKLYVLYINPPDNGGFAKIKGKLEAVDYIYKAAGSNKFNLLIFTPPVNTDSYDYLIFWRAKNNYNYIPAKEKRGTFYLLIEPDPEKPWSYKGWLETVVKTGHIIKIVNLPSGIIVQERRENE